MNLQKVIMDYLRENIGFLHFSEYATVLNKMSGTKAQA